MKTNKYIVFVGMGFELVGIIVSAVIFGQILDQKYQTKGFAIIVLSLGGLVGWIYHLVVLAEKLEKSKEE
jgi:hypothetical protein